MHRCDRNRKRSKRRAIFCPVHGCYLDSASRKYLLFADQVEQLRRVGVSRRNAQLLLSTQTTIALPGEWLEAFWCPECQAKHWYHVQLQGNTYTVKLAPQELWRQASGVDDPLGNPSVGEFTQNSARRSHYRGANRNSMRWAH
jgi:hypothetical protein